MIIDISNPETLKMCAVCISRDIRRSNGFINYCSFTFSFRITEQIVEEKL